MYPLIHLSMFYLSRWKPLVYPIMAFGATKGWRTCPSPFARPSFCTTTRLFTMSPEGGRLPGNVLKGYVANVETEIWLTSPRMWSRVFLHTFCSKVALERITAIATKICPMRHRRPRSHCGRGSWSRCDLCGICQSFQREISTSSFLQVCETELS